MRVGLSGDAGVSGSHKKKEREMSANSTTSAPKKAGFMESEAVKVFYNYVAPPVLIAGAINWLPCALDYQDYVGATLQSQGLSRVVYGLVGLVALCYLVLYCIKSFDKTGSEDDKIAAGILCGAIGLLLVGWFTWGKGIDSKFYSS